nr:MAG TPA: hypothetical protein [Caudoviricetes sp.]
MYSRIHTTSFWPPATTPAGLVKHTQEKSVIFLYSASVSLVLA